MRRPVHRLFTVGLLLALTACAAALEANRRMPALITADRLTPARAAAVSYGPDATRTCPPGGLSRELAAKVEKLAKDRGAPAAAADGRLCGVAEALLSWPDNTLPREGIRSFLGQYFGLLTTPNAMLLTELATEDSRDIAESLSATVAQFSASATRPSYGFATDRLGPKKTRVIMVLMNESIALEPLPRRLEPGQKATLAGTLLGENENPKVLVSDAQGRLTEVAQPPGKAFKAEIACGDHTGQIWVELRAEEMGNERPQATLGVACGTELPTAVALAARPWPEDPAAQEARMVELINAERTAAGLPALTVLEPLAKAARALAESIRDGAKKGAAAAVPVDLVQRLTAADIQAPIILQNPAAGPSAETAFTRLDSSPTHRASMMSVDVNHVGIGVATGTDANGHAITYLMQIFIKVQPPPDLVAYKATVRGVISKKRAAEKLPELISDPALEQLAQDYAASLAAAEGRPPKERYTALVKALDKGFKKVELLNAVKLDPADYAEEPNILAKGKFVGLGTALGKHPAYGKNSVFVVLLIGNKR
jgi:uncharacterized protein YkwD